MFTGIIQTTGKISQKSDQQIRIVCPGLNAKLKKGDSIAVDGICLTVTAISKEDVSADFMPETAQKTTIGKWKNGEVVNLELPMSLKSRFDGHVVTGHVDSVGKVVAIKAKGNAHLLTIQLPSQFGRYIVPKGSITLNGISLTVVDVENDKFAVSVIPHTWEITNLHMLKVGDKVNVEVDILAKYVEKLIVL